MKVIFNVKITAEHTYSVGYGLCTNDKNGKFSGRNVFGESGTIIQDGFWPIMRHTNKSLFRNQRFNCRYAN